MLSIFKDSIRTKRQKELYFWAKLLSSVVCGALALSLITEFLGSMAIAIGILTVVISYATISPVIAAIVCLLERLASL